MFETGINQSPTLIFLFILPLAPWSLRHLISHPRFAQHGWPFVTSWFVVVCLILLIRKWGEDDYVLSVAQCRSTPYTPGFCHDLPLLFASLGLHLNEYPCSASLEGEGSSHVLSCFSIGRSICQLDYVGDICVREVTGKLWANYIKWCFWLGGAHFYSNKWKIQNS